MAISSSAISTRPISAGSGGSLTFVGSDTLNQIYLEISVHGDAVTITDVPVFSISVYDVIDTYVQISVDVSAPSDTLYLPFLLSVYEQGVVGSVSIGIQVVAADAYLPSVAGVSISWRPQVVIGGVDYSVRIVDEIVIEAEEDAARVADVVLAPYSGVMVITDWVGKQITIDYAYSATDGSVLSPIRVFTGVVDVPSYDPITKLLHLRCTDLLQEVVYMTPRTTLESMIGGYWSSGVFEDTDNWQYAQDRLSTSCVSLDLSAYRQLRTTSWLAKVSPDYSYTDVLDKSLALSFSNRSQLKNKILINWQYRYPRLKCRRIAAGYTYPFNLGEILLHGYSIPTKAMIEQAIDGIGWEPVGQGQEGTPGVSHVPVPAGPINISMGSTVGVWDIDPTTAAQLSFGFSGHLVKRYGQSIEENYTIEVINRASRDAVGEIVVEESASMEVDFDVSQWEGDSTTVPLLETTEIGEVFLDYSPSGSTDRTMANLAIQCLVAKAQKDIWASHRLNTVKFSVPLDPRIDLLHTIEVNVGGIHARGKVRAIRNSMDLSSGAAISEITLAISLAGATGAALYSPPVAPVETVDTTPAENAVMVISADTYVGSSINTSSIMEIGTPEDRVGYFTNVAELSTLYAAGAEVYDVKFTLRSPEIEDDARNNKIVPMSAYYDAPIYEDLLTITV